MSAQKSTLVFGSDPEFFATYKKDGKDYVLPAAYFRTFLNVFAQEPDSKHPVFIDEMETMGVTVIEDGVAFEETVRPDTDWTKLFERIQLGKQLLSERILSKFPNECSPETATLPTINYDVKRWQEFRKHPAFMMSMIFGCDRDFNALNYEKQNETVNALKHPFRYGGGHIHVSGSAKIIEEPILAVQSCIVTAGLAAVAFSDTPELDHDRTFLYGMPDRFRPQEYSKLFNNIPNTNFGIEYRTPSNRWTHSKEHAAQLFKWMEIAIHNVLEGGLTIELIEKIGKDSCEAILKCDQGLAKDLLSYVEARI